LDVSFGIGSFSCADTDAAIVRTMATVPSTILMVTSTPGDPADKMPR
jgi:hypothetical protein